MNPVTIRAAIVASTILVGATGSAFLWSTRAQPTPSSSTTTAVATVESTTIQTVPATTTVPSTIYQVGDAGQVSVIVIDGAMYVTGVTPAASWSLISATPMSTTDAVVVFKRWSTTVTLHIYLTDGVLSTDMQTVSVQGTSTGTVRPVTTTTKPTTKPTTVTTIKQRPTTTTTTATTATPAPTTTRPPRERGDD